MELVMELVTMRPLPWTAVPTVREIPEPKSASRLWQLLVLALTARGALTRWRWWRRQSTTMWCSATTPTAGGGVRGELQEELFHRVRTDRLQRDGRNLPDPS